MAYPYEGLLLFEESDFPYSAMEKIWIKRIGSVPMSVTGMNANVNEFFMALAYFYSIVIAVSLITKPYTES